ncbi:MAG: Saccharopine dehydrogenase [Caulobacteraceae bacterium]|nr:MAG: Saccharopine dehydrogenase [Caulobacteraceae bacterium]
MKIVALGGAGQEGTTTVSLLAKDRRVSEIVIADRNLIAANALAGKLGAGRVRTAQIDVSDAAALKALIADADVVANFVGPYYRFGKPTLLAAIEAGVNYVDICDDVDATEACLALDGAAKAADVTAVIGLGASPGLANVLARRGVDLLDKAQDIEIRWQVSVTDVESMGTSAAMFHFFHAIDGDIPQFLDGALKLVPAYSGEEVVSFKSIGERHAFFTAHPEPVTIPRYIAGLRNVTCKGGILGLDEGVAALRALGLTSNTPLDIDGAMITPRRFAMALLDSLPPPDPLPEPLSALRVTVHGVKAGAPTSVEFDVMTPTRMSPITGIPTAVGALLVAQGNVKSPGVAAPEAVFDAAQFLEELRPHGVEIAQTISAR